MEIRAQEAKFNEQNYLVTIFLDNGAGESNARRIQINPNAIINLNIEDTLADWVVKGNITLYYSFETYEIDPLEVSVAANFVSPENLRLIKDSAYFFRNDGNDEIYISIFPTFNEELRDIKRSHWELLHRFSVYDMEDIDLPPGAQNAASSIVKCKKLYFYDYRYHKLITNTLEYSTAFSDKNNISSSSRLTSIPDKNRSIYTGVAMEEVLEEVFKDGSLGRMINITGRSKGDWEDGAATIFYTAPATNSAYDTLMDIYDRHVSESSTASNDILHDFSVLYIEQNHQQVGTGINDQDLGYFALKPISKFFEKAGKTTPGDFQIEHFYLQDIDSGKDSPSSRRSPQLDGQNMQKDTKLGVYSQITSYRFVDISALTNATKFKTRAVHSFDFKNRTFNIEYNQNSVCSARKYMVDKYISNVMTSRQSDDSLFLITLEESKKGKNIEPVYSLYGNRDDFETGKDIIARQADGLQKLLQTGLFQNTCIHFRCLGATNRKPGRFIAIDKTTGIEDRPFNNKFFGQWFIINVKHIFEAGIYYNEIVAIKIHRFSALKQKFTKTINCSQAAPRSPVITPSVPFDLNTPAPTIPRTPDFNLGSPIPNTPPGNDGLDSRGQPPLDLNPSPDQLPLEPPLP
jgi:hypothetical protein